MAEQNKHIAIRDLAWLGRLDAATIACAQTERAIWAAWRGGRSVADEACNAVDTGLDDAAITQWVRRAWMRQALMLACRPVSQIDDPQSIAGYACALHVPDPVDAFVWAQLAPRVARLGMIREFDQCALRCVVGRLRAHPDLRLSLRLDGASAALDSSWQPILDELHAHPEVAQRLTLELAETALLAVNVGRAFANRLRQAGCRIGIGAFGLHFGAHTAREIPYPDQITLDGTQWGAVGQDAQADRRLAGLVALARESAPCVIVAGLPHDAARRAAARAGVEWALDEGVTTLH